jgi:hypothetical protein
MDNCRAHAGARANADHPDGRGTAAGLPFPLLGLDVDNDSAFINSTLLGYCRERGIELTRSRAYKKNDQAWIEQKNGSVVRRMVGYGRLEGMRAVAELAQLHRAARLYVNFFLPSFKLQSKIRKGARLSRKYDKPATPYERLLASDKITDEQKDQLRHNRENDSDENTSDVLMLANATFVINCLRQCDWRTEWIAALCKQSGVRGKMLCL